MTPGARIAAAIEILDAVLDGVPAEKVLTGWARGHRFAGAKDRAAIRDHVFDALRCLRSCAWLGGAETGRGIMLGQVRAAGLDPAALFTGEGYAPPPLAAEETGAKLDTAPRAVRLDMPDWLMPLLDAGLGADAEPVAEVLRTRAPVFLRVNVARTDRAAAQAALAEDAITAVPHPLSPTALEVTGNPRRVQQSRAYAEGLVELQDAASQAVCDALEAGPGLRVLDYCAGGGGKALSLAARGADVTAHDADPARMRDLPARAARAGASIAVAGADGASQRAPYDLVLCDVPCSGSGSWRRAPDAKWRLTPERLAELVQLQAGILDSAAPLVAPGGVLAYVTCSLLAEENTDQTAALLARLPAGWTLLDEHALTPLDGGDGFYLARLRAPQG